MPLLWLMSLVMLAACGRLGFDTEDRTGVDEPAPPEPGPVTVTITVKGQPIAGAYVVVVGADSTTEVLRTDASGVVATEVDGATTIHIAYEVVGDTSVVASEWSARSFYGIGGGTDLVIGSSTEAPLDTSMDIDLPANGAATTYRIAGPMRCGVQGENATPLVTASFDEDCQGASVPLLAISDDQWFDIGTMQLVPLTTASPAGSWLASTTRTIRLNIETPVGGVAMAALYDVRGGDELELGTAEIATPGGPVAIPITSAPFGVDRVQFTVASQFVVPNPVEVVGHLVYLDAPPEVAGEITVDDSVLAPTIEYMAYEQSTRTMRWTTDAPPLASTVATSILEFEAVSGAVVHWMFYAPGPSTEITVPVLPPPLDQLVPLSVQDGLQGVLLTRVDGRSYRELVARIDRELNLFTSDNPAGFLSPPLAISIRIAPAATSTRRLPRLYDAFGSRSTVAGLE